MPKGLGMNTLSTIRRWIAGGLCAVTAGLVAAPKTKSTPPANQTQPTKPIVWRPAKGRLDVSVRDVQLPEFLALLKGQTGWDIKLDPSLQRQITAQFKNEPVISAFKEVFGSLSYSYIPTEGGGAKLILYGKQPKLATKAITAPKPRRTKTAISNELVIVLKEGEDPKALAARYGGQVVSGIPGLNAWRLRFPDEASCRAARQRLPNNKELAGLDSNYSIERPLHAEPFAGLNLPPLDLPAGARSNDGLLIAIIDTAIQPASMTQPEFLMPTLSLAGEFQPPPDQPSHGTSMAATFLRGLAEAGVDKQRPVRILPIDVYGPSQMTSTFDVARGIHAAIEAGAPIINLSLGGTGDSHLLHRVIKQGHEKGVLFLAAAGNEPVAPPTYPAAYPEVLAVTALTKKGNIASYANHGEFVDVGGPSISPVRFDGQTYLVSGTSAASAYVAGVAAGLTSRTSKSPKTIGEGLLKVMGIRRAED